MIEKLFNQQFYKKIDELTDEEINGYIEQFKVFINYLEDDSIE
jgi:hypothetical protein